MTLGRAGALLSTLVRRRRDLRPLARALWLLPIATLRVQRSDRRLVARLDSLRVADAPLDYDQIARALRLQRVVAIVSAHGVARGTCLSRSLTLVDLLRREGLPATLRIGVRLPTDALEAHAWVECGGVVLNDASDVGGRYAAFDARRPMSGVERRS